MFNSFMQWLVLKLETWCERTGRIRIVYNHTDREDGEVYLIRYFLFTSKYFSIYIHRFMMSDLSVPHDHPFSFFGYIVKGEYEEETLRLPKWLRLIMQKSGQVEIEGDNFRFDKTITRSRKQGTWAYRPKEYAHVVKVKRQYFLEEKHKAPLTVIFRGPYCKNWGFWEDIGYDNRKWTYYETYLSQQKVEQPKPEDTAIEGIK